MSCFASCLSDPDEVSAFFASRAAKRYLSKLTPLERLVHREISAHPELVALRDQFQRVDESASGAIPPADLAPVLKLRPGAHCDLALDCFDAPPKMRNPLHNRSGRGGRLFRRGYHAKYQIGPANSW